MSRRVLIIADDNPAMRWLLRRAFRARFEVIVEASDGRELFWHLVHYSRSRDASDVLVITDIQMPGYSGLDVVATYDELGFHPATVVISSFPDADAYARTERAGATLVPKPFVTTALEQVVENVCRR